MNVGRSKLPTPSYIVRLLKENPELLAALICGVLVLLGWLLLYLNLLGLSVAILCAAYIIGGYESAREGLTTLLREKELDVDFS
jgi:Cd2+/Zn2+-exporting ATPase